MRTTLRVLTTLLAISFIGTLQTRAEWCEPATAPCHDAKPRSMDCCRLAHCHCDLSAPSQPASNAMPVRATTATGHELAKSASASVIMIFLAGGEPVSSCSNTRADALPFAAATPYLLTHAFLI